MPFVLGVMALMYYLPYVAHKFASQDIVKLRAEIKPSDSEKKKLTPEGVRKYFFRNETKIFPPSQAGRTRDNEYLIPPHPRAKKAPKKRNLLWLRYVFCMGVKFIYIGVNVAAFFILDSLLMGGFRSYGIEVYKWTQLNHTEQFDYLGPREHPKPSKLFLYNERNLQRRIWKSNNICIGKQYFPYKVKSN